MHVPKPPAASEEEEVRRVLTATGRRAATSDALGLTAGIIKQQRGMHASEQSRAEQRYRKHGMERIIKPKLSWLLTGVEGGGVGAGGEEEDEADDEAAHDDGQQPEALRLEAQRRWQPADADAPPGGLVARAAALHGRPGCSALLAAVSHRMPRAGPMLLPLLVQ